MSELGSQLVANEQKRRAALIEARSRVATLLAATSFGDEEGLCELDRTKVQHAIDGVFAAKRTLRRLRREREELVAAQGAEGGG